jgi:hypothetical protein
VPAVDTNEEISNYPSSVDLINAVKVSGRTEKDLGLVLNGLPRKPTQLLTTQLLITAEKSH